MYKRQHKAQVTANLLREMGRSALFLNQKMRILAQNRLRNRIKLYLQMLPAKQMCIRDSC